MSLTILSAINNLVENNITEMVDVKTGRTLVNARGDSLELYVKNLFAGSFELKGSQRDEAFSKAFSYLGNQNNPPDFMIRGGDAVEVKKIGTPYNALALNSSYPKHKLYSDDSRILDSCRDCEKWNDRDILYAIGTVKDNFLTHLVFVYGVNYAASREVYLRISKSIKSGIFNISDVTFEETNELGRVNGVDPLGITNMRIRGMWSITNPLRVFADVYHPNEKAKFNFMAIIDNDKFSTLPVEDVERFNSLLKVNSNLFIKDIKVKDPNNPANLKAAKLITFFV